MRTRKTTVIDRREMTILTAYVLHKPYAYILAHPDHRITTAQRTTLLRLARRRSCGVPLPYLVGTRWFYGNTFSVGPGVLIPRPETELLIDVMLERLPRTYTGTIVDVGTGSGCIAISLAKKLPRARIFATERSLRALTYARRNAKALNCRRRVTFLKGDLLAPLYRKGIVPDIIVANLPYATPEEYRAVQDEPRTAIVGGRDGMAVLRRFFSQLKRYRVTARILLEIDPKRHHAIAVLAHDSRPTQAISVRKDLAGLNRVVIIQPNRSATASN